MDAGIIVELASVTLGSLSGLATIYLAMQLAIIRRNYEREARAAHLERTLRALQLPASVSKTMDEVLYKHSSDELRPDTELAADVRSALGFLETLATGILADVYDEDIAHARLADSLSTFYEVSRRFIYESRSNRSSASLYVQLEQLVRRWDSRDRSRPWASGVAR